MHKPMPLDGASSAAQQQFSCNLSVNSAVVVCPEEKTMPEDRAAEVVEKVKNRDRQAAEACKKAAQKKYGVRPRNYFGYMGSPKETAVVKSVLNASNRQISPELLYTIAIGEGLNDYFHDGGKKARKGEARVSGFDHIGLDDFGSDVDTLKKEGFLRNDFDPGDEYAVKTVTLPPGEVGAGTKKRSATFRDLPSAMEALGADLAWRRNKFSVDAEEVLGEVQAKKLTDQELDYWTYIYFNAGLDKGKKRLEKTKSAAITKWKGDPEGAGVGYSTDARSNALVRMATMEYIRCTGVFKSAHEECAESAQTYLKGPPADR